VLCVWPSLCLMYGWMVLPCGFVDVNQVGELEMQVCVNNKVYDMNTIVLISCCCL
jgi:hypothetical protein